MQCTKISTNFVFLFFSFFGLGAFINARSVHFNELIYIEIFFTSGYLSWTKTVRIVCKIVLNFTKLFTLSKQNIKNRQNTLTIYFNENYVRNNQECIVQFLNCKISWAFFRNFLHDLKKKSDQLSHFIKSNGHIFDPSYGFFGTNFVSPVLQLLLIQSNNPAWLLSHLMIKSCANGNFFNA